MRRIAITTVAATLALGIAMGATAASQATSSKGAAAKDTTATTTSPAPQPTQQAAAPTTSSTTTTQKGPATTGQPNQNCETLGNQPGASMSAPGSAFNPNGTAGSKYAGEQPQNSRNTASVSQYDVGCARPAK